MSNAVLSQSTQPGPPALSGVKLGAAAVLAVWFIVVVVLGASGAYVAPPGTSPWPLLAGVLAPVLAYFTAYRIWGPFRQWSCRPTFAHDRHTGLALRWAGIPRAVHA